ncbi:MAG: OmpA family protein [Neomegalonema sp.]|nr:OmpA family protein [Neomegalonema sp.]
MTKMIRVAAVAVLVTAPTFASANNSTFMPGQRFLDTFTIQDWLDTKLPGGDYVAELAVAYQERADYEAAYSSKGDTNWYDATAFAAKSKRAAAGEEVKPWEPSVLGVDDATVRLAYEATVKRSAKYRDVAPAACAQMVALYDHFLEQYDETTGPLPPHSVTAPEDVLTAWVGAYKACYTPTSIYGFRVDHCKNTDGFIPDEPAGFGMERTKAAALAKELGADEASGLLTLIDAVILVEGHASTTAGRRYNKKLSECRSGFIADLLITAGVSAERVEKVGLGELKLEVPTADGVEEYRNRRVVVIEK